MKTLNLSIIIPTRNSEKTIGRLLDKLSSEIDPNVCEIIISDGCSTDSTIDICKKYNITLINNPDIHAAAGRNLGIAKACGEVCAFIDSDCVPSDNWSNEIRILFAQNNDMVGFGGGMLALPPINNIERFSGHVFLNEIMKFPIETHEVTSIKLQGAFITANCAYKKQFLLEIGGFDNFFSNHGEDIDLFWRSIIKKSGKLIFYPKITVNHSFPDTVSKLCKKYVQYGIASTKLKKVYSQKSWSIDKTLYWRLLKYILRFPVDPRNSTLYILQLSSHIWGKAYASIIYRTINL